MTDSNESKSKYLMDDRTAIAFAINRFEELHPRNTWPTWFNRCSGLSWSKKDKNTFEVFLDVTTKATRVTFRIFSVAVNRSTGEVTVLEDYDLSTLHGPDLLGYEDFDPFNLPPLTPRRADPTS